MLADQTLEIRQSALGDRSDRRGEAEDRLVGQAIRDEQAFLSTLDQGRLSQRLQMLRGVREREPQLGRQGINRPLPLREQLQNLEPVGTGERLADAGELPVETVFEAAMPAVKPISYAAARRPFEMGVRMTRGASRSTIVQLILRDAVVLVGAGSILGSLLSFLLIRAIWPLLAAAQNGRSQLFSSARQSAISFAVQPEMHIG
jgi:hypothetical protein